MLWAASSSISIISFVCLLVCLSVAITPPVSWLVQICLPAFWLVHSAHVHCTGHAYATTNLPTAIKVSLPTSRVKCVWWGLMTINFCQKVTKCAICFTSISCNCFRNFWIIKLGFWGSYGMSELWYKHDFKLLLWLRTSEQNSQHLWLSWIIMIFNIVWVWQGEAFFSS